MAKRGALIKLLLLVLVLPVRVEAPSISDMAIKDVFNSVGSGIKKAKGSLSEILGPVKYTAPVAPVPAQYHLKDRGVSVTDADIEAIRPVVYGEVSNRTPDKQALESHVIINTALNRVKEYNARGQKKSLSDVIAMPNQYQAYGGKQYQEYGNPSDPVALAKKKQIDLILDQIAEQIRSGQYEDNTGGAYFYVHNPDQTISYDNKRPLFAK